jgi:hypothetical protein
MVIQETRKDFSYYSALPYRIIVEKWDDGDGPYYVARVPNFLTAYSRHYAEKAVREIEK